MASMIPLHDDNPTHIQPVLTITFIVMCCLVFFWQFAHDENGQILIVNQLGVIPAVLLDNLHINETQTWVPASLTVFTSMFLHGGWMHLIGNMLYLWVFGNNIEDAMGHVKFVIFYLLCGVAAVFAQAIPDPNSVVPMVGASGAISGVLGAYLLLYPRAKVLVGIPIFIYLHTMRLPAMWVLGAWFALQLFSSLATAGTEGGGVAFGAHIGGFIAGMVLIPFFKNPEFKIRLPFGK
ncbi:MAG: rhomboid family intramembrane serine protease [Arenicellales bacterium]